MRHQKRNLLVEVAGKEVALDIEDDILASTSQLSFEIASELAKQHNVYTDFGKPLTLTARIFSLTISKGTIKKSFMKAVDISVRQRSMGPNNYAEHMRSLVSHLPDAAKDFVCSEAWDRGHSYGYDECYNIAQDLVSKVDTMLSSILKNLPKSP